MTLKIGCFSTSTCSATVTIAGISSVSLPPTTAPSSIAPSAKPSVQPAGSHSYFHLAHRVVSIRCEYRLELRLVSSAGVEHSRGDLTPSYSRSAAPVRDTVGEMPSIHGSTMCITIQSSATVPSGLPTIAPTAPTVIPTIKPSSAPQVLPCPRRP